MTEGNKKILIEVKPKVFNLFFKDAPELIGSDIETIVGEVVGDESQKK
jgi:hypothetical protein